MFRYFPRTSDFLEGSTGTLPEHLYQPYFAILMFMTPKAVDLTKILTKEHERKWVALTRDNKRVVAFDDDLIALDKKVGDQDVVFMKVPASDAYLSF